MDERSRDARQSAEYSARTVDEALRRAAEALGLPIADVEYEVVKDSSRALLGVLRTGQAIIRVWPPTTGEGELVPTAELDPTAEAVQAAEPEEKAESAALTAILERNPPELEREACDVVSSLLDKMGLLAAVEVVDQGGEVDRDAEEVSPLCLNVVGDDLGILIGRRGETLRDLQFITRLILRRKLGVWPNLVVDVEGYKDRRADVLGSLASRMADRVRQTGLPVALEPMPAYERRIIHLTLSDDPDVYTESTGEGEARKVQILPK